MRYFVVEMAEGWGSEAFYQVYEAGRHERSTWIIAGCTTASRVRGRRRHRARAGENVPVYRFRVAAGSLRGGGLGKFSEPVNVVTASTETDVWENIMPTHFKLYSRGGTRTAQLHLRDANGNTQQTATFSSIQLPDTPTGLMPKFPSARRGHTMTMMAGFAYVFGGWSKAAYVCDRGETSNCYLNKVSGGAASATRCRARATATQTARRTSSGSSTRSRTRGR